LNELQQGVPFEEVAKKYSDDPETSRNGGVVRSYITVGVLIEFWKKKYIIEKRRIYKAASKKLISDIF
jgi:hypothetical protein